MDMVQAVNNFENDEEKSRKSKRMRMNAITSEFKKVASVFNGLCKHFDEELDDHHDFLLFGNGTGKQHYCRILNLSKFVGAQLSRYGHAMSICNRCFNTYYGVNANQRLS